MKLSKYRLSIIVLPLIAFLYLFLRLLNLTELPIFTDEAIYLRWAQIALNDSSWRFISLTDGKQPMFVWVTMLLMKFIEDPILAGRLVSVISGFFTMVGLWFLARELFNSQRIALLSSFLYVCYPFAQVADRMALYDSLSGAFFIWALYFSVLLVRYVRLDLAYTLGFLIGAGALNKSTNFFSAYLLPFTLLLIDIKSKDIKVRFIRWVLFAVVAVVVSQLLYAILRLSPLFHMVGLKNELFLYSFFEWFKLSFVRHYEIFNGNFDGLTNWLGEYLKLPYIILIGIGLFIPRFIKEKLVLFLYFLLPYLALAAFAKIVFPRFIFFMTLSLLPLAAVALDYILERAEQILKKHKISKSYVFPIYGLIIFLFVAYSLSVSYTFAVNPKYAKIANPDRAQYVNHWTAGWGVEKTVTFLREKSQHGKIYVATEGTFGLMPYALELYLVNNPNITIKGFWPINEFPEEILKASQKMPTYFIFYQPEHRKIPDGFPIKLIFQEKQGETPYYYRLYQVIPNERE